MFDWFPVDGYLAWIGVGTATLLFLGLLSRAVTWLLRKIRQAWRLGKAAVKRAAALADLLDEQLKPNHGSSLIDRVGAISQVQKSIEAVQATQERHHNEANGHWAHLHEADAETSKEVSDLRNDVGHFRHEVDQRLGSLEEQQRSAARFWEWLLTQLAGGGPELKWLAETIRGEIERVEESK